MKAKRKRVTKRTYIGTGVYVEFDGTAWILTKENSDYSDDADADQLPSDIIHLTPKVVDEFFKLVLLQLVTSKKKNSQKRKLTK